MSNLGDYPDFTTGTDSGGVLLENLANFPVVNSFGAGPFYVGGWGSVTIYTRTLTVPPVVWRLDVAWSMTAGGAVIATSTYELHVNNGLQIAIPVVAPYISIDVYASSLADSRNIDLSIQATKNPIGSLNGAINPVLIRDANHNIAANGQLILTPSAISYGMVTMTVFATANTWNANVEYLAAGGAFDTFAGFMGPQVNNGGMVQFMLAPLRYAMVINNTGAAAINVWSQLTLNRQ